MSAGAQVLKGAPGPCESNAEGLIIPIKVATVEEARAIYYQIEETARLRELTPLEKNARRTLKRADGVRQPSAVHEFKAIAKSRVRDDVKAARRARRNQATAAGQQEALRRLQARAVHEEEMNAMRKRQTLERAANPRRRRKHISPSVSVLLESPPPAPAEASHG